MPRPCGRMHQLNDNRHVGPASEALRRPSDFGLPSNYSGRLPAKVP